MLARIGIMRALNRHRRAIDSTMACGVGCRAFPRLVRCVHPRGVGQPQSTLSFFFSLISDGIHSAALHLLLKARNH
jgi:hypothetical protein